MAVAHDEAHKITDRKRRVHVLMRTKCRDALTSAGADRFPPCWPAVNYHNMCGLTSSDRPPRTRVTRHLCMIIFIHVKTGRKSNENAKLFIAGHHLTFLKRFCGSGNGFCWHLYRMLRRWCGLQCITWLHKIIFMSIEVLLLDFVYHSFCVWYVCVLMCFLFVAVFLCFSI